MGKGIDTVSVGVISYDDRFAGLMGSHHFKSAKVCVSMNFSAGINRVQMRVRNRETKLWKSLFLQGWCVSHLGDCGNWQGDNYAAITELEQVCWEDGNSNGGLHAANVPGNCPALVRKATPSAGNLPACSRYTTYVHVTYT